MNWGFNRAQRPATPCDNQKINPDGGENPKQMDRTQTCQMNFELHQGCVHFI